MEDITADPQFADDDVEMKAEDTTTKPVSEPDEAMLAVEISIDIPNSKRGREQVHRGSCSFCCESDEAKHSRSAGKNFDG